MTTTSSDIKFTSHSWFRPGADAASMAAFGFRLSGGGAHQSKTIMLTELARFLGAAESQGVATAVAWVTDENLLEKKSAAARQSSFRNLNQLYALTSQAPINRAMRALWAVDEAGRPLLAMLCSLARDPLLRDSAPGILPATVGSIVEWEALAQAIEQAHPERFSPAMLRSMAQNCNSSWTQSGHLKGTRNKKRARPQATPEVAAFAALLARRAGFGGPALLNSPWLAVLDIEGEERLSLLRLAQGRGLVRMRQGGGVFEIDATVAED